MSKILINFGIAVRFGMFMFAKKPIEEFKRRLRMSVKTYLFVILPLLVLAAIIEGFLIVVLG